jgi:ubiquinone/menaquinone biosynthesis C-methylase UbiE
MTLPRDHKDLIREEFTRQAPAFTANPSVSDPERVARLIGAVRPPSAARVLDVATGPGYVALGFAAVCREVVGIDLTPTMLEVAERQRQERGLSNVRFQVGDAEHLPFADEEFDVIVCRLAFHHLTNPAPVLHEMVRVCQPNGTVAVEDLVVSEHPERAAYQNRFENLRDPSHTRAYPLSEVLSLFAAAGLEVENVQVNAVDQAAERWMANAHTPEAAAAEVRAMIERDAVEDLSGTRPFHRDGVLYFTHRAATVVGRRLASQR